MGESHEDRKQKHYELLKKSRDALNAEQSGEAPARPQERRRAPAAPEPADAGQDENVVMYRGRPVATNRKLATPGAGGNAAKGRQFRGATGKKGRIGSAKSAGGSGGDAVKDALRKLTELHNEGLITQAEFDRKRQQLLDRL